MAASGSLVRGVRKIAVVRANGVGDLVFALPALESLAAAYPQAEIVLLGKRWQAEFLHGRPGPIDRVVVIPPTPGVGEPNDHPNDARQQEAFFAAMAEERFDVALQLHGGGRYSNPFVKRLGARLTAGLKAHDAAPLDRWLPYVYLQSEVARYLEVVSLVGASPVMLQPRLVVTERDLAQSLAVVPPSDRPLVTIHPGATDSRRYWPIDKFAQLGDRLAAAGCQVVITGMGPERPLVEEMIERMQHRAVSVYDRLPLPGLAGLLSRSSVVVGNDSGPIHLAEAVGAPTVGIYWCGNMINGGPLTRGKHRAAVSWRMDCPECGRRAFQEECEHRSSFVAEISIEEVLEPALELLSARVSEAEAGIEGAA